MIQARVREKFKGEEVIIPILSMIPTDMSFEFKRIQFPRPIVFRMFPCRKPSALIIFAPGNEPEKQRLTLNALIRGNTIQYQRDHNPSSKCFHTKYQLQ